LWVRQGRTDAWIAHTLDISIDDLARFKREHQLEAEEGSPLRPADPLSVPPPEFAADDPDDEDEELDEEDEVEDDEAEEAAPRRRQPRSRSRPPRNRQSRAPRADRDDERPQRVEEPRRPRQESDDEEDGEPRRRRRRGRRGGRRHRPRRNAFEATFDHGEEGYGLWLDPSVVDNPVYSEHWAGHRAVTVTVEADSITIRRAAAATATKPDGAKPDPDDLDDLED
jgi:hypothetical protein